MPVKRRDESDDYLRGKASIVSKGRTATKYTVTANGEDIGTFTLLHRKFLKSRGDDIPASRLTTLPDGYLPTRFVFDVDSDQPKKKERGKKTLK